MQLGRLGAWYSTDKLGGPAADRGICADRRTAGLRHAVVSGITWLRIVLGRRLHAGAATKS